MGSRRDRIDNEAARRREAQVYNGMLKNNTKALKQEVHSFLADIRQKHSMMSLVLNENLLQTNANLIKDNEMKRLKLCREDARRRAGKIRMNAVKTRGYLRECAVRRLQLSSALSQDRARYVMALEKHDRERRLENQRFMNEQRMYLFNLLG